MIWGKYWKERRFGIADMPEATVWLDMCKRVATRGTCPRLRVGCVIVKNDGNKFTASGNGSPHGTDSCDEVGCDLENSHCVRALHAEARALISSRFPLGGAVLYCTDFPCYACAKLIVEAGIVQVCVENDYKYGKKSKELFSQVGIAWTIQNPKYDL